jgi:hypothetical protein
MREDGVRGLRLWGLKETLDIADVVLQIILTKMFSLI